MRILILVFATLAAFAFAEDNDQENQCAKPAPDQTLLSTFNANCAEDMSHAFTCCNKPRTDGCKYDEMDAQKNIQLPAESNGIAGPAATRAREAILMINERLASIAVCVAERRKVGRSCQGTATAEAPYRNLGEIAKCYDESVQRLAGQCSDMLATYASAAGPEAPRLAMSCFVQEIAGEASKQCLLVDAGTVSINENAPGSEAGITTGYSDNCSNFTDGDGVMHSAAHCEEDWAKGEVMAPDGTMQRYNADGADGPAFDKDAMEYGAEYDDHTTFATNTGPKGNPSYTLDDKFNTNITSGCEVINGSTLSCAESSYYHVKGVAEVSGMMPPENGHGAQLVVSRGPAYYDKAHNRWIVNAYSKPHLSGGPVSFPAGTDIGGYVTDRPVIIGANSGNNPGQQKTDSLITVPIMGPDSVQSITVQSISDSTLRQGATMFAGGL